MWNLENTDFIRCWWGYSLVRCTTNRNVFSVLSSFTSLDFWDIYAMQLMDFNGIHHQLQSEIPWQIRESSHYEKSDGMGWTSIPHESHICLPWHIYLGHQHFSRHFRVNFVQDDKILKFFVEFPEWNAMEFKSWLWANSPKLSKRIRRSLNRWIANSEKWCVIIRFLERQKILVSH